MIDALFALALLLAAAWIISTGQNRSSPAIAWPSIVALKLSLVAMFAGPESASFYTAGLRGAFVALAFGFGAYGVIRRGGLEVRKVWWVPLYFAVVLLSTLLADASVAALRQPLRLGAYLAIFVHVTAVLDRKTLLSVLGQFMVGLTAVTTVVAVLVPSAAFRTIRAPAWQHMLEAPLTGRGPVPVAIAGICTLTVGLFHWSKGRRYQTLAVLGFILLVLSLRRSVWLAGVVALLTWLYLRYREKLALAILGVAVIVAVALFVPQARDLWDREQATGRDNITSIRWAIFEEAIDRFEDKPILGGGLGIGNVDLEVASDLAPDGSRFWAHTEYGTVLSATGIVGGLIILWAHISGLIVARRAWLDEGWALPLAVAVGSLALTPFSPILSHVTHMAVPYLILVFPCYQVVGISTPLWLKKAIPSRLLDSIAPN